MARTYSRIILSDSAAKDALRNWPMRPTENWGWARGVGCGPWLRALPKPEGITAGGKPHLVVVGNELATTHPDGLWVSVGPKAQFVDLVAVEHCGKKQNFYDKRSRYMPSTHSRMFKGTKDWLDLEVPIQKGTLKRIRDLLQSVPAAFHDFCLPVRHLRVLYALKPDHYDEIHLTPFSAHEFFCPHSSLLQKTSGKLRGFVKALSTDVHWYTS